MDDFGGKLRQARERRGISLRQIAASTKIAAAALEALERNDISKLPGGIFSRAFVRSYAVEVGLDPDETVREFLERFNQEPPSAEAIAAAIPEQERTFEARKRKAARTLGVVAVAVPLLAVAAYFALRGRSHQSAAQPPTPAARTAAPPPETVPSPPASAPDAGTASAPSRAIAAAGAPSAARPVPAGTITLDVHPTAVCWVSLTVDGRKLFARVMTPGEHESHTIAREAVIEIGDAGAFAFSVDGRPGKSIGETGQVKTLKLTPSTAAQYLR